MSSTPTTPPSPKRGPPKRAAWFQMTDASSVGIEMVVAVTLCTLAGFYIERYLTHWSPWTTLIGIAVGCMTAARAVVRAAKTYQRSLRESSSDTPARDDGRPS